jgi:hypothetical protein
MLAAEAKERMREGGHNFGRGMEKGTADPQEAIKPSVKGEAAQQAADLVGASARLIYDMKRIEQCRLFTGIFLWAGTSPG